MAGLKRYTGNRLELLAGHLTECIRSPLSSPLSPEIVIVQSKGMERWLSMELARQQVICANIRFPFPNTFLDELFGTMLPQHREAPAYDPEITAWRIMGELPTLLRRTLLAQLRSPLPASHPLPERISIFGISGKEVRMARLKPASIPGTVPCRSIPVTAPCARWRRCMIKSWPFLVTILTCSPGTS